MIRSGSMIRWRNVVVIVAPVALVVFSLAHGIDWVMMHGMDYPDPTEFIEYIARVRHRWATVHLAGLVIFPLIGLSIWWMLPPRRIASTISRAALIIFIIVYTAFDAVAGIGSYLVVDFRESLPAAEKPLLTDLVMNFLGDAWLTGWMDTVAGWAWSVAVVSAVVAMLQQRAWRVAVPLVAAGYALKTSHFPPWGAVAGVFLFIAAWQFLVVSAQPEPES